MDEQKLILREYKKTINDCYENEYSPKLWYPMFYSGKSIQLDEFAWVRENYDRFLKGTPNEVSYNRWYFSEMGYITALEFEPNGAHVIVAHTSGLIQVAKGIIVGVLTKLSRTIPLYPVFHFQMRHGSTGSVMSTLRNVQFPPKPIYALEYSKKEENICYASCMDGNVYKVEVPQLTASIEDPPKYCIRVDPALQCLNMQFYGAPGISSNATPFVTQRTPALSLGLTADHTKMIVGYADTSIRVYDMETQEADLTYVVHKLRIPFIPPNLQRMHFGQVCALKCDAERPYMFASGAWDKTLRIWDIRCKVGCVMTFEGVNICSNSIDLHRNHCIAGSWQTTEALTLWDLVAKKKVCVIRVQNRRHDVDGEYIYACRYWNSTDFNRKGKYAIIGGSGTNCVEVINIHNRYISCSYPASGSVLAVASHQDRIAFGGTATTFNIVRFHDPKHEKDLYQKDEDSEFDYTKSYFVNMNLDKASVSSSLFPDTRSRHKSVISNTPSKISK